MDLKPFARALGALVGVAALGAVLFVALLSALEAAGVERWAGSPAAASAVVPVVLAVADAYTPLGNNRRTSRLRERPAADLGLDLALTAAVGFVVGYAGAVALLGPSPSGLARTAVVAVAVALGYGTFIARNRGVYLGGRPVAADDEFDAEA